MTTKANITQGWKIYLFSALVALVVSFAVIKGYQMNQGKNIHITQVEGVKGKHVLYTADDEGNIKPLDFTDTSQKVLDAVVHIKSIRTREQGSMGSTRQLPGSLSRVFWRYVQEPDSRRGYTVAAHGRHGIGGNYQ